MNGETLDPAELDRLAARVQELYDLLAPQVPEIDPTDLVHIIEAWVRGPGSGMRFFLRPTEQGHHVL